VKGTDTSTNAKAGTKDGNEEGGRKEDTRCDVAKPVDLSNGNVKVLRDY